ncbi:twin-arginine translocation signal domain-containing protein [Deinococcus aquaedulcis]|uniref:twin-arginine translocation signal domain-containing protein n=1 Tax=Deinococcus aquaedulcis TaxID=2840455 RepID=UPI001C82906B|nr:twin-arginine translocation signal domain-containing protein [Deinococcus aquaedulcis]
MTPGPSRRSLLKAAAVLPALLGTGRAALPGPRPLRLAVLLPVHESLPGFTAAFLAGLQPPLHAAGASLQVTRSGPGPAQLRRAAAQALAAAPDALITLGDGVPELLGEALPPGLPVIAAGPGAAPTRWPARAGLLGASLHAWEAEWLMGAELARRARPTFLLISPLDSGYDLPFAFSQGLARGGRLVGSAVLGAPLGPQALSAQLQAARARGARHLHLQDSAQAHAALVRRAAQALGLSLSVGSLGHGAEQVRAQTADGLHPAAALGQDVGNWLAQAAAALPAVTPLGLVAALGGAAFRGTRGDLHVTPDGLLRAPLALVTPGRAPQPLAHRPPAGDLLGAGLRSGHLYAFPHAAAPG